LAKIVCHCNGILLRINSLVRVKTADQIFEGCGWSFSDACHQVIAKVESRDVESFDMEFSCLEEHIVGDFDFLCVLSSETKVLTVMERRFGDECRFIVLYNVQDFKCGSISIVLTTIDELNTNQSHVTGLCDSRLVIKSAQISKLYQMKSPSSVISGLDLNVSGKVADTSSRIHGAP
jgi:hypothetical protein